MRRRQFLALVGAAVIAARPALAQPTERVRKLGILEGYGADDPVAQERIKGFTQALRDLGWIEGDNLHIDLRWAGENAEHYREYAQELVALAPDVIFATITPSLAALQRATRSLPIVFSNVIDPVGAGFVTSLAHPGGNTTGFTAFEYSISGKWLGLLKDLVPGLTRIAVIREPSIAAGVGQFAAIQAFASSTALELTAIDPSDVGALEPALEAFGQQPHSGVIVAAGPSSVIHRGPLIDAITRHRLLAVYPFSYFTAAGGLASYGPDSVEIHISAAKYVDRVLKGERPADLPVQAPTLYRLSLNLKAAQAIGLAVPPSVLSTADDVIE
jgi:putative tryptophan/tyrosine transport system substrate-binding protein